MKKKERFSTCLKNELGNPSGCFAGSGSYPSYVIKMAKLGEETGTLDQMMAVPFEYYEKESILMKSIKTRRIRLS